MIHLHDGRTTFTTLSNLTGIPLPCLYKAYKATGLGTYPRPYTEIKYNMAVRIKNMCS